MVITGSKVRLYVTSLASVSWCSFKVPGKFIIYIYIFFFFCYLSAVKRKAVTSVERNQTLLLLLLLLFINISLSASGGVSLPKDLFTALPKTF